MHSRVDFCQMQILANMAVKIPGRSRAPRAIILVLCVGKPE